VGRTTAPVKFPQHALLVCFALNQIHLVLGQREPNHPATKNLARLLVLVKHPQAGMRRVGNPYCCARLFRQCPSVGLRFCFGLLGRDIGGGTQNDARLRCHTGDRGRTGHIAGRDVTFECLSQTEIQKLHRAFGRDLHVCWLEVAVDNL
jgi:hypothetical protein